jgi:hypothetical protein
VVPEWDRHAEVLGSCRVENQSVVLNTGFNLTLVATDVNAVLDLVHSIIEITTDCYNGSLPVPTLCVCLA